MFDRDEPRFATAARTMMETGDYIVPKFNGALRPDKPPLVFAAMRDKHVGEMLEVLLPEVSRLVVTAASTPRSAEPEAIAAIARELSPALAIDVEPGVAAALDRAWRASPDIVVAGSIFLLGDVLKLINRT